MPYWSNEAKIRPWGGSAKAGNRAVAATPAPPLGPIIRSLLKADLGTAADGYKTTASIQNLKLVTSYNWLDEKEPTMLVPGNI